MDEKELKTSLKTRIFIIFIPLVLMLDDILIINFVWKQLAKDLLDYKLWRLENNEGKRIITPEGEVREYVTTDFKLIDPSLIDNTNEDG